MKALTKNGIDESTIAIGTLVNWQAGKIGTGVAMPQWGAVGDVVSYIERDADGTITQIAFGSWLHIFTNRMKLDVQLYEPTAQSNVSGIYTDEMAQVGRWYKLMQLRKLITVTT